MIELYDYRGTEFLSVAEISNVQDKLFRKHLEYLALNSPYYRRILAGSGAGRGVVKLADITSLPFTDKTMFSEHNDDFLAVPMSRIVDIVLSSGTTGSPAKVMYTENDLKRLAYNEEISFLGCGLTPDDIVLLTCTMDRCFIAGLAYFSGARSLGAAVIRNGLCSFESHLDIIRRIGPTALIGVPTLLLKLGRYLRSRDIDPRETGVAKLICIGEPIRDKTLSLLKVGENIEEVWGAKAFSTYASSETITSFCECSCRQGGHLHPELAIVEIIDEQGRVLSAGETGEVVITPLNIEGMPFLRYKTGDVSFLMEDRCGCGRHSPRLGPILGRKKQMIKFLGTTLYPNAIYSVLEEIPGISEYCVEVISNFDLSDIVKVYVSGNDTVCSSGIISERLQARLRVRPEVVITGEEEIRKLIFPGNSRKVNHFVDRRTPNVNMS
jgi:phenylacetate-CoA ligase